ncbi:uncharacterized protein LOC116015961 [Ipomoea triloba]|uniref:uncharacterized protein LOC116015961 n=1 Tax=Ipomoea triloba TaxID=35885 RepID=UPI00125E8C44|nr:uncharacterized protein LOC116015961 [Ipomoea triloba]
MEQIRAEVRTSLRITGDVQVGSVNAKTILLRFSSEEDCKRVLMRNWATVSGARAWLSRWSPEWRPWCDSPFVPVWIEFPNLPFHLFDFSMLERICEPLGKIIDVDRATEMRSRPSVAKVRIEIDMRRPVLHWMWIGAGVKGFWQRICYDFIPKYCTECCCFGHLVNNCRRKKKIGEEGEDITGGGNGEGEQAPAENENRCMPHVCENVSMIDEVQAAARLEAEAVQVEQSLEELARKGISVDQFIGEAVLEAAVHIIEKAADDVMEEKGVEEVEKEGGGQAAATGLVTPHLFQ